MGVVIRRAGTVVLARGSSVSKVDHAEPKPLGPLGPLASAVGGLNVKIAAELLERARAEGGSLVGQGGPLQHGTRTVLQVALEAEMADHPGYERGQTPPVGSVNERNGSSATTVRTEIGEVRLAAAGSGRQLRTANRAQARPPGRRVR
jgi:hypothetical protein